MLFEETLSGHVIELIWRVYFFARKGIDLRLKKLDLTYPQFGTLVALSKQENISQKKLALALGTDTTNVMVVCDSLEKKNLIERRADPVDRRVNLIVRTKTGKKISSEALIIMEDYVTEITGQIKKKELAVVTPILKKLYKNLMEIEQ